MKIPNLAAAIAALILAPSAFGLLPEFVARTATQLTDVRGVYPGDFNGDGRSDVIAHNTTTAWLLTGRSDGTFSAPVKIVDAGYILSAGVADLNGDERPDLVLYDSWNFALSVITSKGDGTFNAPVVTTPEDRVTKFAVLDLNADGTKDLVFCSNQNYTPSTLTVLRGAGDGTFTRMSRQNVAGTVMSMSVGDFDRDGRDDVEITEGDLHRHDLYYTSADGSLEPPVAVPGAAAGTTFTTAADLDGDGYVELISAEFSANTVTVIRNLGSRQWALPVSYDVTAEPMTASPYEIAVGDVSGDGKPDVVTTLANAKAIATFQGSGDGTLLPPVHTPVEPYAYTRPAVLHLCVGDIDGDGRPDVSVSTSATTYGVVPFINASGEVDIRLTSNHPVVTPGLKVLLTATIFQARGASWDGQLASPSPGGDVVIETGGTVLARGHAANSVATIELPALEVGEYSLTARLEPDSNYKTRISSPITQKITNEPTRLVLTSSTDGSAVPYGHGVTLSLSATSNIAGSVDGTFWLYTDGVRSGFSVGRGPYSTYDGAGTHEYRVEYDGDNTFPPGTSNTVTQVIVKAKTETSLRESSASMYTSVQPQYSGIATGVARIYDWRTLIAIAPIGSSVDVGQLTPGTHYLRAEYEGDDNCEPSRSDVLLRRAAGDGFRLAAFVRGTLIEAHATGAPAGTQSFLVERRVGTAAWSVGQVVYSADWMEAANPSTPYTFRMTALGSHNEVLGVTNTDTAMLVTFTDDPLNVDTPVKALHLTELENATNALRAAAGLGAIGTGAQPGEPIRALHFLSLYSAINEARAVLGSSSIPVPADIATGGVLRMQHLQDLREALH